MERVSVADVRKPTVVIADDHRLVLSTLRRALETAGFDVCGEAQTGADALELILSKRPELALLDVHMPEGGGDAVAAVLANELPDVKVILLTATPNEDEALNAMRLGALGYIDKSISPRRLAHVLHDVANGEASFPRRYIPRMARELRPAGPRAA